MARWTSHGGNIYSKVRKKDQKEMFYIRLNHQGRQYMEKAGSTIRQARILLGRRQLELDQAKAAGRPWIPPSQEKARQRARKAKDVTLSGFTKVFLKKWVAEKRDPSYYRYRTNVLIRYLGKRKLRSISRADCERFYRSRCRTVSLGTANHDLKMLVSVLNRAIEWGYIESNVARRVDRRQEPENRVRFLQPEEATRLLDHCPPWLRAVVAVALHTGMRRGEVLALTWSDVDLDNRMIYLGDRGGPRTKTRQARQIPMNDTVAKVLLEQQRANGTDRVFHKNGRPITPTMLRRPWAEARTRSEITDFRFHDLRHTAASWMAMGGVPLLEIQTVLGHSSPRMTMRYAHLAPDYLRNAVNALDRKANGTEPRQ